MLFLTKYVGGLYRDFWSFLSIASVQTVFFIKFVHVMRPNKPMTTGHVLQNEKSCFHYRIRPD